MQIPLPPFPFFPCLPQLLSLLWENHESCSCLPQPGCMWAELSWGWEKQQLQWVGGISFPTPAPRGQGREWGTSFPTLLLPLSLSQMSPVLVQPSWGGQEWLWCFPFPWNSEKATAAGRGWERDKGGKGRFFLALETLKSPWKLPMAVCLYHQGWRGLGARECSHSCRVGCCFCPPPPQEILDMPPTKTVRKSSFMIWWKLSWWSSLKVL